MQPPGGLYVTPVGSGYVMLHWNTVPGATGDASGIAYQVLTATSPAGPWHTEGFVFYGGGGPYSLEVPGPTPLAYYAVTSLNRQTQSAMSEAISSEGYTVPTYERSPWDKSGPCDCGGAPEGGSARPDPVDLSSGIENFLPGPDITVFNPIGPSVSWQRQYNTGLAQTGSGSPGLPVGWAHSYDYSIQSDAGYSGWGSLLLTYPNGSQDVLVPTLDSSGNPTGAFSNGAAGASTMTTGVPSSTVGVWTSVTVTFKNRSQFQFESPNSSGTYELTQITNRMGEAVNLYWDPNRDLTDIKDGNSKELLSLSYGSNGILSSVTDSTGSTSRSVYYTSGLGLTGYSSPVLESVSQIVATGTGSPPAVAAYGYTAYTPGGGNMSPFLTTNTVPNPSGTGNSTATINYNSSGQVSSLVDANGNQRVYTYGSGSTTVNVESPSPANTVVYTYTQNFDSSNRNTGTTDAAGKSTVIAYSGADPTFPSSVTDADSFESQFSWDSFGNLTQSKTPQGTTTTYYYNYSPTGSTFTLGELTKIVEGSKTETDFYYNEPSGLVNEISTPIPGQSGTGNTQSSTFYYTTLGNISEILSPGNNSVASHETTFGYAKDGSYSQSEALGEPIVITDSNLNSVHLRYDSYGNLSSQTDAAGNEYQFFFNLANQETEVENPATGQTGSGNSYSLNNFLYPGGPLESVQLYDEGRAGLVRTESLTYGNEGELLSKSGDELAVGYGYNAVYQVTSISNGLTPPKTTSYRYNTTGELYKVDYADGTSVTYPSYDYAHKVLVRKDARATPIETDYTYASGDGLLSNVSYPASGRSVNLTYDAYDRTTGVNDSGSGVYGYSFDDLDDQTGAQTTYAGQPEVDLGYAYYPDGALETETIPGSKTFAYTYDAGGRPAQLVNPNLETTVWSYQHNDWLSRQTSNNGNYVDYIPNAMSQLTELANYNGSGSLVSEVYSIAHDAVGNISDEHVSVPGYTSLSGEIKNTFDSLDQIATSYSNRSAAGMNYDSPNYGFGTDAAGNLTTLRSGTQAYNQPNNEISGSGFVYDNNGNPTTYEGHTVKWDEENRMTEYDASTTLTCGWRPDGMRAWKSSNSTTTYFYYDQSGMPVLEEQGGSITAIDTFGPNGLISRGTSSTNEVYYQFDERGNTVTRSDSLGNVLGYHGSDTFGIQFGYDRGDASDPYLGFGAQWGYYRDSEIVFLLLGHRIYDPGYGRFLNQDPIGYSGGINLYSYGGNSPTGLIDPSGFDPYL